MVKLNYKEYVRDKLRFESGVKLQRTCCGIVFTDFNLWNDHQIEKITHRQLSTDRGR